MPAVADCHREPTLTGPFVLERPGLSLGSVLGTRSEIRPLQPPSLLLDISVYVGPETDSNRGCQCPSQSWELWAVGGKVDQGGWCCLPGMVGAYQNDSSLGSNFGVGCFPGSGTLTSTLGLAATVATTACSPPSSSISSTTTTPSTTTSTSTSTPPPLPGSTDPGGGGGGVRGGGSSLSPGGIAGAVVGSVAGLAMLAALGAFLFRKRRPTNAASELGATESWKHEETQTPGKALGQAQELPSNTERHEMHALMPSARHELPS